MASYPTAYPTIPDAGDFLDTAGAVHSTDLHDKMRDELLAFMQEVGLTPSGASFATVAARMAGMEPKSDGEQGPDDAGPTAGATVLAVNGFTLPEPDVAGRVHAWGEMSITKTVATDTFQVVLNIDSVAVNTKTNDDNDTTVSFSVSGSRTVDDTGTVPVSMTLARTAGTGTATVASGSNTVLHAVYFAAP